MIQNAVRITAEKIESVRINTPDGLEEAKYPITALHEIITNAVLHRDYSVADNPPNKDVGEGLNTAFTAMREMKLKPPLITQVGGSVQVILKHEPLASPEEVILEYLNANEKITNRIARDLCFIGSENKMKGVLQRLVRKELIELVPGTTRYSAAYQLVRPQRPT